MPKQYVYGHVTRYMHMHAAIFVYVRSGWNSSQSCSTCSSNTNTNTNMLELFELVHHTLNSPADPTSQTGQGKSVIYNRSTASCGQENNYKGKDLSDW